jgi:hypothetical protein
MYGAIAVARTLPAGDLSSLEHALAGKCGISF